MRILQINTEAGWRGGERQTLLTLRGLQAGGHEVGLLARAGSALGIRAGALGCPLHEFSSGPGLFMRLVTLAGRYDILHAQTARAMTALAVLRPCLRARLVFTRRTAFEQDGVAAVPRHRWKWSRADALVAISEAAAVAPRALDLAVQVIPSAVEPVPPNPDRMAALSETFGLAGRRVLVTAAALSPEKDPLTLIEAVARLRQHFPDVLCLHCGAPEAAAQAAHERVRALRLEDHYRFAGFQDPVADALALAEVYVSSSRFEALGTSVLDACLAGRPVVATDVGGHREILDPDRGLLVPAGDPDALARRIGWVLRNPVAARAMATRARAVVEREFSVPAMVARYESVYQAL